jgi:hypothetical protein
VFPVFAESRACPLEALESSMSFPILEHVAKTARHTTLFPSCGAAKATPIVFGHGAGFVVLKRRLIARIER